MSRLLLLLLVIASIDVRAQSTTSSSQDAFWQVTTIRSQTQATLTLGAVSALDPSLNEVRMKQEGVHNTALLSVISNTPNRMEVGQSGNNNYTEANLSGLNNSLLLNQTGNNNSVSIGLGGTNNRISLTQDGGDRIQMQRLQVDNTRLDVSQGNGNNSLTISNTTQLQNAVGTGISNLRIEQSGGAAAIIQNGRIFGN
ncbi:hypothetical protein [Spirosoma aerophilum]